MTSIRKIITIFALGMISLSTFAMEKKIFNVGQGSCNVISFPAENNNVVPYATIMHDAGSLQNPMKDGSCIAQQVKEKIVKYIIKKSPNKKLIVLVSHPDLDHFNWVCDILEPLKKNKFKIRILLGGDNDHYFKKQRISKQTQRLEKLLKPENISYSSKKDEYKKFKTRLPDCCKILSNEFGSADPNDDSLVTTIRYAGDSIELTGDATKKIMEKIDSKPVKTLISPHHGAENCIDQKILNKLQPAHIIFSSGLRTGRYLHPRLGAMKASVTNFKDIDQTSFVRPHLVIFSILEGQENEAKTLESKNFKILFYYEKQFAVAVTTLPIATTATTGDVTIKDDTIVNFKPKKSETILKAALSGLEKSYFKHFHFDTLTIINFKRLKLDDDTITSAFTKLPISLKLLSLQKNNLTPRSAEHFAKLLAKHKEEAIIEFNLEYPSASDNYPHLKSLSEEEEESDTTKRELKNLERFQKKKKYSTLARIKIPQA